MRARAVGIVKAWDARRGFGFIATAQADDVFVHVDSLVERGALAPGQFVEFIPAESARGPRAERVRRLGPHCPKCSAPLHGLRCDCGQLLGT